MVGADDTKMNQIISRKLSSNRITLDSLKYISPGNQIEVQCHRLRS